MHYVIYIGFYFQCSPKCFQPTAYVMSNQRWRCNKHHRIINQCHTSQHIPRDNKFYVNQLQDNLNKEKTIHNQRLGVQYTCTIKRFHDPPAYHQAPIVDKITYRNRGFFKLYCSLTFDMVRSHNK